MVLQGFIPLFGRVLKRSRNEAARLRLRLSPRGIHGKKTPRLHMILISCNLHIKHINSYYLYIAYSAYIWFV